MKISDLSTPRLIGLQHKLNVLFVNQRDAGENIECIYRQLRRVEDGLSRRRISW